jgi:alanyl-tRNA synthetase
MTDRLYYTDSYRAEFRARIVERADDGHRIYLDATAFYPTSGGQPHDLGTLGGATLVDVIDEDDRIAHVLKSPLGDTIADIEAKIDWRRRYDHMQQHTGQHLLSAVFEDLFGYKTVSVHFGPDYSTLDLDTESVSPRQIVEAEARANAIGGESRPVTVAFEDARSAIGLRKASDRDGTLRIVSIEGIDRSACGGTHVRSTAEIGAVLLRGSEKVRKATRIEFLCGARAVRRARHDFEELSSMASALSASLDDVGALVQAQTEKLKESDTARRKLAGDLAVYRAHERYDAATPAPSGVRVIVVRDASAMDEIKAIAQAAFGFSRAVVVGAIAQPPSVLVAASEDSGADAGRLLKETLAAAGGRGGGSPRLAQGSVPDAAALDRVVQQIIERV